MMVTKLDISKLDKYIRSVSQCMTLLGRDSHITVNQDTFKMISVGIGQLHFHVEGVSDLMVPVTECIMRSPARVKRVMESYSPVTVNGEDRYYPYRRELSNMVRGSYIYTSSVEQLTNYWMIPDQMRFVYTYLRFYKQFMDGWVNSNSFAIRAEWCERAFTALLSSWFILTEMDVLLYRAGVAKAIVSLSDPTRINRKDWARLYGIIHPGSTQLTAACTADKLFHITKSFTFDKKGFNK